jgi:hypothetical protein
MSDPTRHQRSFYRGTCHDNLVTRLVIIHERGKNREVFTTSGTYLWSLRSVELVGQELLTLSLVFQVCFVDRCPFVLFLLAIVLSVLLRYTDSDYHFGIFKLFLLIW